MGTRSEGFVLGDTRQVRRRGHDLPWDSDFEGSSGHGSNEVVVTISRDELVGLAKAADTREGLPRFWNRLAEWRNIHEYGNSAWPNVRVPRREEVR